MASSSCTRQPAACVLLTLVLMIASMSSSVNSLQYNYYATTCPLAESTVKSVVSKAIKTDKRVGAAMLRVFFHDCFVEGCDASVLIDSTAGTAEKNAIPNQTLHSLEVIDNAKAALEAICPKTVSCADIVAFAAATSVQQLGGPQINVLGGRLDGLVSSVSEANANIPSPFFTISQLQSSFAGKGLNDQDLVVLSGAHTIGKAHCGTFTGRLRNFSSSNPIDPSLNPKLAQTLSKQCPVNFNPNTIVSMDATTNKFDNKYFTGLLNNDGIFTSDAQLLDAADTKAFASEFAGNQADFFGKFAVALVKMGNIGIKTGANGNIRTSCRSFT